MAAEEKEEEDVLQHTTFETEDDPITKPDNDRESEDDSDGDDDATGNDLVSPKWGWFTDIPTPDSVYYPQNPNK